jgi:hypothetical protein
MLGLTTTDYVLLAIANYVAIVTLVRLMRARRDELLGQLRSEFTAEKARLAEEKRRAERKAKAKQQKQKAA